MIKFRCTRLSIGECYVTFRDRVLKGVDGVMTLETMPPPEVVQGLKLRGWVPLKDGEDPYPHTGVRDDVVNGENPTPPASETAIDTSGAPAADGAPAGDSDNAPSGESEGTPGVEDGAPASDGGEAPPAADEDEEEVEEEEDVEETDQETGEKKTVRKKVRRKRKRSR